MWKQQLWSMAQQADLQELLQTAFVAAIFAFMLAKLIAMVISIRSSIRGGNLRIERLPAEEDEDEQQQQQQLEVVQDVSDCSSSDEQESIHALDSSDGDRADVSGLSEGRADISEVSEPENPPPPLATDLRRAAARGEGENDVKQQQNSVQDLSKPEDNFAGSQSFIDLKYDAGYEQSGSSCAEVEQRPPGSSSRAPPEVVHEEDDSDWEGVESTELDETFGAASSYVATQAGGLRVPADVQLQLYGLYKVATEGSCRTPQPSAIKMTARSKWNAWQKLGDITAEEAMERYIKVVCEICPEWIEASSKKNKAQSPTKKGGGAMGPVFSTLVLDDGSEGGLDSLHDAAREGNETAGIELLDEGVPVDLRDSHGGTALHWATDRGHLKMVEILLARGADIQAKDKEGQTALHMAAINEHEAVAKYLVKHGADVRVRDVDGATALSLAPAGWDWMEQEEQQ